MSFCVMLCVVSCILLIMLHSCVFSLFRFKQIFLLYLYVFLIVSFYFYACSSVYFTFSAIAMSLLLSLDLRVRLLRAVQQILNTQYDDAGWPAVRAGPVGRGSRRSARRSERRSSVCLEGPWDRADTALTTCRWTTTSCSTTRLHTDNNNDHRIVQSSSHIENPDSINFSNSRMFCCCFFFNDFCQTNYLNIYGTDLPKFAAAALDTCKLFNRFNGRRQTK